MPVGPSKAEKPGVSDEAVANTSLAKRWLFPRRRRTRAGTLISQCFLIAGLAYGAFILVTHFVVQSVEVVGNSMSPTLADSDRYLLNRWVYLVREPQPSDIVVILDPSDHSHAVKRIIAREGDAVLLKDGRVFVNGRALSEPYLPRDTLTYAPPTSKEQMVFCGKNEYFVLGDNRNNSCDSRVYGPVPRQNILGMIIQ